MSQIKSIQALRAGAALAVTFGHLEHEAASLPTAGPTGFAPVLLDLSGAGVDLFFVISGFVMVYASRDLFAAPGAARLFLLRRAARIVPLYWLVTTLFLLMLGASHVLSSAPPTAAEIIKSYLFIPYGPQDGGAMQPVYKLGWTLNYEVAFYLVFAATLVLPARLAVAAVVLLFSALVALGVACPPEAGVLAFWANPIILEFAFGAALAIAYHDGLRFGPATGGVVALAGVAGFAATTVLTLDAHGAWRPLVWGVPAALLFAGPVLSHARRPRWRGAGALVVLGDASYAIYLLHPLVVRGLRVAVDRAAPGTPPWLFVGLGLLGVVPLAILVHDRVERPLTRVLCQILGVRSTNSAGSERSLPRSPVDRLA